MSMRHLEFRDKEKENKDFINDLIYENIALMDSNIKLLVENRRLRERVEILRNTLKRHCGKAFVKKDEDWLLFLLRDILKDKV
jgi:hypothetical protein